MIQNAHLIRHGRDSPDGCSPHHRPYSRPHRRPYRFLRRRAYCRAGRQPCRRADRQNCPARCPARAGHPRLAGRRRRQDGRRPRRIRRRRPGSGRRQNGQRRRHPNAAWRSGPFLGPRSGRANRPADPIPRHRPRGRRAALPACPHSYRRPCRTARTARTSGRHQPMTDAACQQPGTPDRRPAARARSRSPDNSQQNSRSAPPFRRVHRRHN